FVARQPKHIVQNRIRRAGHAERRCEQDRRFDLSQLIDLSRACQLAERIADKHRTRHFLPKEIATVRQDRRYPGSNILSARDSYLANLNASYICEAVQRSRGKNANNESQVARAG